MKKRTTASATPGEAEVALQRIKEAAEAGNITFADDTLTDQLDTEIQEVFRELTITHRGREPKRPIWTADGINIGIMLDYDATVKEYTQESLASCRIVGEKLGIELTPHTLWEDAGLQLRSKRSTLKS